MSRRATLFALPSRHNAGSERGNALLKEKRYTEGSLYERIEQAAANHVITKEMAVWSHRVRVDANDPRHVDVVTPHATQEEAEKTLEFALALAQFLFVLPARVARGVRAAGGIRDKPKPVKRAKPDLPEDTTWPP